MRELQRDAYRFFWYRDIVYMVAFRLSEHKHRSQRGLYAYSGSKPVVHCHSYRWQRMHKDSRRYSSGEPEPDIGRGVAGSSSLPGNECDYQPYRFTAEHPADYQL